MFAIWQFVRYLLVQSVTWMTWNSDDYRDAGGGWGKEAKYANGARTDAATDNGSILTLILLVAASVN